MMLNIVLVLMAALPGAGRELSSNVLEHVAAAGVSGVLSRVLGVPVNIGRVQLNLRRHVLEMNKLDIGNPGGFSTPHAIAIDRIRVEADIKSLFSDNPLIHLILVEGASVNAEINTHGINLKKLFDHTKSANHKKGEKNRKKTEKGPEKRFRIEKALAENGALDITTEFLQKRVVHKTLDRLELSLMGQDGNGVTANEAVKAILQALIEKSGLLEQENVPQLTGSLKNLLPR